MSGMTVAEKIWRAHVLDEGTDGRCLLYVDRHLVHEVTSPLAFEELRTRNMRVRRPDLTLGLMDHDVPTGDRAVGVQDELCRKQMEALTENARDFGVPLFDYLSPFQGISHVVAPELGFTLPGIVLVCGDSHTSTHGAFGALAFGIGTSEVAHVLATQALWMKRPKDLEIRVEGKLAPGVMAKDVALAEVGRFGAAGAFGHIIEYRGGTIKGMSMEERMTLCNMATEGGARAAIIAPDDVTFEYLKGSALGPRDAEWDEAVEAWKGLPTDPDAKFDGTLRMEVSSLQPQVTWGTNPSMVAPVDSEVPSPEAFEDRSKKEAVERALRYMGLSPGTKIVDIQVGRAFIGSCTNGRLSDLVSAARAIRGKRVHPHVRAMVVPGSQLVKRKAEELGLHNVFMDAGFEWRNAGCSLCLGMNEDRLLPGERAASTCNRNFEDRQGAGGRTHLASPVMVAAAAVEGHFVDVREWDKSSLIGSEDGGSA